MDSGTQEIGNRRTPIALELRVRHRKGFLVLMILSAIERVARGVNQRCRMDEAFRHSNRLVWRLSRKHGSFSTALSARRISGATLLGEFTQARY